MAVIASDDFSGVSTVIITGRTLNNSIGGSGTRTWAVASGVQGMSGNNAGAVVSNSAGAASFVTAAGVTKARVRINPNGGTDNVILWGRRDLNSTGTANGIACLFASQTSLRVSSYAAGSRTDRATLTVTAPGTTYWLELEVSGLTVTCRILNNDTSVRNEVSHTFTGAVPSGGDNWGFGFAQAGTASIFDDFILDDGATGDVTAPTLTSATATATSATTANGGVTTDEAGPAWAVLTTSSTTPSAAQIKAGQNHTGAAASASATATLAVGANPGVFAFTGLTAGQTYWEHVVQDDTATPANTATPITSASSITTPAPDTTDPSWPGGTTLGATAKTDTTVTLTASADATDNVGVTGYEWSSDDGASYPFTSLTKTFQFTALTPLTSYPFKSRAYDAAGRKSAPIALTTSTYRAGDTAANILANTGPVGGNPAGFLYAFASTVTSTDWLSYTITSGPTPPGGTLTANADGSFTYFGPDAASMVIQPEVNMVDAAETITVTLYDQTADTTPPVLTGSITVTSLTSTGYNLSWPTGTDNIGVTAYEYSLNGGSSWTSQAGTSVSITGRTPESTDEVRVRAKDAAGNVSTPALSASVTLLAAPDVTAPLLTSPTGAKLGANGAVGSVSTNEATGLLFWITTTGGTATKAAVLLGSSQPVTVIGVQNVTSSGLTPLTTYYNHFVHRDAAGNESLVASSAAFTTDAAGAVVPSKFNDGQAMRSCMWNPMKKAINA